MFLFGTGYTQASMYTVEPYSSIPGCNGSLVAKFGSAGPVGSLVEIVLVSGLLHSQKSTFLDLELHLVLCGLTENKLRSAFTGNTEQYCENLHNTCKLLHSVKVMSHFTSECHLSSASPVTIPSPSTCSESCYDQTLPTHARCNTSSAEELNRWRLAPGVMASSHWLCAQQQDHTVEVGSVL